MNKYDYAKEKFDQAISALCHAKDLKKGLFNAVANSLSILFIKQHLENLPNEIKKRFSKEIIERLLHLKWWEWDIEKITENIQHLTDSNIDKLGKQI